MKRKLIIMILYAIILNIGLNYTQTTNYAVENDGEIEWNSYNDEKLV